MQSDGIKHPSKNLARQLSTAKMEIPCTLYSRTVAQCTQKLRLPSDFS